MAIWHYSICGQIYLDSFSSCVCCDYLPLRGTESILSSVFLIFSLILPSHFPALSLNATTLRIWYLPVVRGWGGGGISQYCCWPGKGVKPIYISAVVILYMNQHAYEYGIFSLISNFENIPILLLLIPYLHNFFYKITFSKKSIHDCFTFISDHR